MSASLGQFVGVLAVAAGCHIADVDYTGKQCPCPQGYSCNPASNTCARFVPSDGRAIDTPGIDGDAPPACPANGFFCDGFETGDLSRWTTSDLTMTAALTVGTKTIHSGSFALDASVPAMNTSGSIAAAVERFPSVSSGMLAVRAWFNLPQPLIHFDSVITIVQAGHVMTLDGDDAGYWTLTEHTPTGNPPDAHSTTLSVTNTWTCVEVDYYFAGSGKSAQTSLYVSDASILTITPTDTAPVFDEVRIGVSRSDAAGDQVIVDDVVLATQHIGCN